MTLRLRVVTHNLSFSGASLLAEGGAEVIEQTCPWCEASLKVELRVITDDESNTCPECLTTWSLEDEPVVELALAA